MKEIKMPNGEICHAINDIENNIIDNNISRILKKCSRGYKQYDAVLDLMYIGYIYNFEYDYQCRKKYLILLDNLISRIQEEFKQYNKFLSHVELNIFYGKIDNVNYGYYLYIREK